MAYTAEKPNNARSPEELRRTIKGWGVDLDPADRPGVPKERFDPQGTGAHWHFPERQTPTFAREKSTEHKFLTPVFGTACPLRGVSGMIRRFAYRYSEGRLMHWMMLVFADRVDIVESSLIDLARGKPDNFIRELGVKAEFTRHGFRSRVGRGRADVGHQAMDAVVIAARGALAAFALYAVGRGMFAAGKRLRAAF